MPALEVCVTAIFREGTSPSPTNFGWNGGIIIKKRGGKISSSDRRAAMLMVMMYLLMGGLCIKILTLTVNQGYVAAAAGQSKYTVTINQTRGKIYDCNFVPLAGGRMGYKAVILPNAATSAHLKDYVSQDKMESLAESLSHHRPFVTDVADGTADGEGVTVYKIETRYAANSPAVHTVGYLNGDGEGVSGIERAYDSFLALNSGNIKATYQINAGGGGLQGPEPIIADTTGRSDAGVVLTIDYELQRIAQQAADKHLTKGAVVVMELPEGKVRAAVSVPVFEQNDILDYLDAEDSPMLNRNLSAYDVGSTFKLVVAACALDRGISPDFCYECTGSMIIGENTFHCNNRSGHGELTMDRAIEVSCNTYFIALAQQIGGDALLEYAKRFGLGKEIELAKDYFTSAGKLPSSGSLKLPAALANFSFGQGELMATPMHIVSIVGTIANDGQKVTPVLLEGIVDSDKNFISRPEFTPGRQVCSRESARLIQTFMRLSVTEGTGRWGASDRVDCAAKTGTAQTGMRKNGHQVLQAWYAGYFPIENPKYAVVVLAENGLSGGADAGPVFKYIADELYG